LYEGFDQFGGVTQKLWTQARNLEHFQAQAHQTVELFPSLLPRPSMGRGLGEGWGEG
jgi:hypothetical protein